VHDEALWRDAGWGEECAGRSAGSVEEEGQELEGEGRSARGAVS